MPLFEYTCEACEHTFEVLVRNAQGKARIKCDACGSTEVRKLFSVFAASASGAGSGADGFAGPTGCPTCGAEPGGACQFNN